MSLFKKRRKDNFIQNLIDEPEFAKEFASIAETMAEKLRDSGELYLDSTMKDLGVTESQWRDMTDCTTLLSLITYSEKRIITKKEAQCLLKSAYEIDNEIASFIYDLWVKKQK